MVRKKDKRKAASDEATQGSRTDQDADLAVEESAAGHEPAPANEPPTPEQRIAALEDEKLRLLAELRNVTQRAEREKQEALRYAEADFTRELLIVLDDLERTLESTRSAENVESVAEGVRIVYDHFLKVLGARKIEPIEAVGQPFDPDRHEAMMQQPSHEHAVGVVMQELARGYKMRERVIRPTKVVVSGGPPQGREHSTSSADEE